MNPLDQFFDLLVRVSADITEEDLQDPEMQALVGQFLTIMNPPPERLDMNMLEQLGSITDKSERFRQAAMSMGYHQPEDLHDLIGTLKAHDLFKGEDFEKGARGDWKKEGYKISHEKGTNSSTGLIVTAHSPSGEKVGYAEIDTDGVDSKKPYAFAHTVSVHPDHRRKGIATAMHEHAEKELGVKLRPHDKAVGDPSRMTAEGQKIWDNPKRPFGEK